MGHYYCKGCSAIIVVVVWQVVMVVLMVDDAAAAAAAFLADRSSVSRPSSRSITYSTSTTKMEATSASASASASESNHPHSETSPSSSSRPTSPVGSSKFAGLMPGDSSAAKVGWKTLEFAPYSNTLQRAILPDDECPTTSMEITPPLLHNRRELYYQPSLLSQAQVDGLLKILKASTTELQERESRCIVAIEDGVLQPSSSSLLSELLVPLLQDQILPFCQSVFGNQNLAIADALVRSYDPQEGRQSLPPHYDISSFVSAIIPLNPLDCEGGLYVQSGASIETRRDIRFHAAGDAVVHRFDVMHGVQVRQGTRYSLVVWMAETHDSVVEKTAPWVERESTSSVHAAFLQANNAKDGLMGIARNEALACHLYEWAAARGHAHSQYVLALWKLKERQQHSQQQAVELLQQASDRGLASAQHMLGTFYKEGYQGLEQNWDLARDYLGKAASQGYGPSVEILEDSSRWQHQQQQQQQQ